MRRRKNKYSTRMRRVWLTRKMNARSLSTKDRERTNENNAEEERERIRTSEGAECKEEKNDQLTTKK
jgi:hypothetical protein